MCFVHFVPDDKPEEVIFREYGLMKRLLGEASSGGVCDVSGLTGVRTTEDPPEDMFYAVYRDGMLRAWSAEVSLYILYVYILYFSICAEYIHIISFIFSQKNQRVHSTDVCKFDTAVDYEDSYCKSEIRLHSRRKRLLDEFLVKA